ncbi:aldehyde ferredoxin oxidoreductase C-terminal domain-containing protein, partial [Candidatus Hodarchaeum mangrovi]
SKNLKAIVIREPPSEEKIECLLKNDTEFLSQLENHYWYKMIKTRGTFSLILPALEKRIIGIKNCSRLLSMNPEKISSFQGYRSTYDCWKCPIRCSHNKYQDFLGLGLNLKITDLTSIQNAIEICASEALDPLSLGASIGSLLNIQEDRRKLLDEVIGVTWGDPALLRLIDSIISVTGLGEKLARGETYLYKQTSEPSPAIKNQFAGLYYYPNTEEIALAHSISSYSASELHSDYMFFPSILGNPYKLNSKSIKGIVKTIILLENILASMDSLVLCSRFLPFILVQRFPKLFLPEEISNLLFSFLPSIFINNFGLSTKNFANSFKETFFELKLDLNNLFKTGNRITLLERLFNTRAGFTKSDDQFEPFISNKEFFKKQERLLEEYYQQKGLTNEGMVTKKSLKKTGLLGLVTI